MSSPLSTEKQLEIRAKLKDVNAEMLAVRDGILDPMHVLRWKLLVESFKTQDTETLQLVEHAKLLSTRDEPVLVCGESGTGKEIVAGILHGVRLGQMVAVNTCAVTDTLFESELFGHTRGSFTGAEQERKGLITQAANGTLFLDEIGDMPLHLQSKLLRVIQNRVYRKVGSNVDEEVKCRIIAATHQDLPILIKSRLFRLDLYERLAVFTLHIKPLRERRNDIPLYWPNYDLTTNITDRLEGNVRQLLNHKLRKEVLGTI